MRETLSRAMIHGRAPWVSFLKTAARVTRCGTPGNLLVFDNYLE